MHDQKPAGFTLIEILLAVGLILVIAAAMVQLGLTAMTTSDASRMRSIAIQLVDGALETARFERDDDPAGFFNLSGNRAINSANQFVATTCDPSSFSVPAPGDACVVTMSVGGASVDFYRVVNFSGGANSKEVTAYVFWDNRGNFSSVSNSTILTRWRN